MNVADIKNYEAAVSYCLGIPRFTGKNSMELTKAFYEYLGKPGGRSKIVHVAGTNGKGSVCAFLQSICMQMKQKVGMFTSPHLYDIRERIRINGVWITKEEFLESFVFLAEKLADFQKAQEENTIHPFSVEQSKGEYHPSFFEWLFFIAMLHFEKTAPDVILLETGLGGRLDTTNCIENPALTIITKIGFDHMEYLGDTIAQIAGEKAGIIKSGVTVVSLQDKEEAKKVIEEKARSLSSPCIFVSKEQVDSIRFLNKRIAFSYKSRYYDYVRFLVAGTAAYQIENAILAVRAAEELFYPLYNIPAFGVEVLQEGIRTMYWEGRMEEVVPGVFLDGAHNEDGIKAFLESVYQDGCTGQRTLLFSAVSDKRYEKMAQMITDSGLFDTIYTAPMDSARGITGEALEQLFERTVRVIHAASPQQALGEMLDNRGVNDYLYVAGSLYLIGQLKEWFKELADD